VCVIDERIAQAEQGPHLKAIVDALLADGKAWGSLAQLSGHGTVLRFCVSNLRSTSEDVGHLVAALERARAVVRRTRARTGPE
jgi:hypothetical protein